MYRILIVDDEYQIREGSATYLREEYPLYEIDTALSGYDALEKIKENAFDIMFLDIKMKGLDGIGLLEELKRLHLTPVTAIVSGFPDFKFAQKAMELGAKKYLVKPFTPDELSGALKDLIKFSEENRKLNEIRKSEGVASSPEVSGIEALAKEYVDMNYTTDITVRSMATDMGVNPDYLGKIFKKEYGLTINEYLNKVRINQAILLFSTTKLNVGEVSERVGFNDQTYFSTIFKKLTGHTPSEYRT